MKHTIKVSICCLIVCLLAACFKTDKPKPTEPAPHVPDTILTAEKLIGKWDVTESYSYFFRNDTLTSSWEAIKGVGVYSDGKEIGGGGDYLNTILTFEAGGTFNHTDKSGKPNGYMLDEVLTPTGKWSLGPDSSIQLTTVVSKQRTIDTTWTWTLVDSFLQLRTILRIESFGVMRENLTINNMVKQK